MGHTDYETYADPYGTSRALRVAQQENANLKEANHEMEAAIKENSIVLLAMMNATSDTTMRDLLLHVHDSLTDAL